MIRRVWRKKKGTDRISYPLGSQGGGHTTRRRARRVRSHVGTWARPYEGTSVRGYVGTSVRGDVDGQMDRDGVTRTLASVDERVEDQPTWRVDTLFACRPPGQRDGQPSAHLASHANVSRHARTLIQSPDRQTASCISHDASPTLPNGQPFATRCETSENISLWERQRVARPSIRENQPVPTHPWKITSRRTTRWPVICNAKR